MSKKHTPSETLRILQMFKVTVKCSLPMNIVNICSIPPLFKHIFLQYCTMWGLVSYSVLPPDAVRRSMTLTTSLVCVFVKKITSPPGAYTAPHKRL
jgi:hypothetical protein